MTQQLIKQAYALRTRIEESGSLNINELLSFLKKVEGEGRPVSKKSKNKYTLEAMLEAIDKSHRKGRKQAS